MQTDWIDSLERYIFCNYSQLLTKAERQAWYYFIQSSKFENGQSDDSWFPDLTEEERRHLQDSYEKSMTSKIEKAKLKASADPTIANLLENYEPETFFRSVTYRILRDKAESIFLNLCPQCLNLCRTPRAKLCLRCGHNWRTKDCQEELK